MSQFASTLYPQTNPTNPILLDSRKVRADGMTYPSIFDDLVYSIEAHGYFPTIWGQHVTDHAQIDHASRVLSRLAALSG